GRLPALLSAQSEALPFDWDVGARRSACAGAGRRSRHPYGSAALPRLEKRRACCRAARHSRILARRPGKLRHRLFFLVRGSAGSGRHRTAPHHARLQRADVPHLDRHAGSRSIPRTDGRVDAPAEAARRDPRGADYDTISLRARRTGAHRQAGDDRHQGRHEAGLRRRGGSARRRIAGVLGLRCYTAIGYRNGEAGILHHALSRQHAGDGPAQYRICDFVDGTNELSFVMPAHSRPKDGVLSHAYVAGSLLMAEKLDIAIVGAGMGGLAAAAALRKVGHKVTVYEQAKQFTRLGAGIQIGCNAMHVLRGLGLENRLRADTFYPRSWNNRDWKSGEVLFDILFGPEAEQAYGAPYLLAHRGDLHAALASAVPSEIVKLDHR